jgi:enediyne biosynthesis protein E4
MLLGGCSDRPGAGRRIDRPALATAAAAEPPALVKPMAFVDVASSAGVRFRHVTGAFGQKWFPETNGSGAVFFDFDADGHPDLFLVNSRPWSVPERRAAHLPPAPSPPPVTGHLFRNRGDGSFTDVTAGSGLDVEIYGMGAAAGDYDNDGREDLYVTGIGRNYLFHNEGGGHFREVAGPAGVKDRGWSSSAAWVDVDRDGLLDLFVCHYVRWSPATDVPCSEREEQVYCGPNLYRSEACRLFHNNGNGSFTDLSARAGIQCSPDGKPFASKALGVAVCDVNRDGWPDLAVANDTERNFLFVNKKDGTFAEKGIEAGIAYPESGEARSGMGIDAGDWQGSGQEGLLIGNFPEEMLGLYRSAGDALFTDVAESVGVGRPSLPYTTFGCLLVDLDNDGWLDIATANGHIDAKHDKGPSVTYAQRPLFFRNEGGSSFRPVTAFPRAVVGRGLAAADIDGDGDLDLVLTTNGGAPLLLRNETGSQRHSLRVRLEGVKSNRSGIGAEVTAWVGGRAVRRRVRSGSSYLSQSELPVTLGLGEAERVDRLEVSWPSGAKDLLVNLPAGRPITVREGQSPAPGDLRGQIAERSPVPVVAR